MDIKRTTNYYYLRLKRLQGTPESLAMGLAIGAGIGITPTLPLHTIIVIGATLFFRVNTFAGLIAAVLVSNPLTFFIQYYLAWKIGNFLLPHRLTWERIKYLLAHLKTEGLIESLETVSHMGFDTVLVMMTGGIILAIPTGIITYFVSRWFFVKLQIKRQQKKLLNEP